MEDLLVFNHHFDCEDYEGFLTGQGNFRFEVAKTQPYKGNRKDFVKPAYYGLIGDYLTTEWAFQTVEGEEADDALGKWATKLGDEAVICSIDKDLDMIPGWHYNFVKREKYYVGFDEGLRFFCTQLLTGDRTDNITGVRRGCGPVTASRILETASDFAAQLKAVSEEYRKADNGDLSRFRENCRLLWIRRNIDGSPELIEQILEKDYAE